MSSLNESMLEDIPNGENCYIFIEDENTSKCNCKYDFSCDKNIIKKICPYKVYIDNGLTQCTLLNITSEEDEDFENERKVCGFNELDEKI